MYRNSKGILNEIYPILNDYGYSVRKEKNSYIASIDINTLDDILKIMSETKEGLIFDFEYGTNTINVTIYDDYVE